MSGLHAPMKFIVGNEDQTALLAIAVDDIAIPTMDNGEKPKYVACVHDGVQARELVKIAFGSGTTVAVTVTTGFPVPAHEVVIFDVSGFDVYAIIGTLTGIDFTIVPLENF